MEEYEGLINIISIHNSGEHTATIGTLTARFVRYPGCQQLSVWLPESWHNGYGDYVITTLDNNTVIEKNPVSDKVSGSVLMTWDTIAWAPGEYQLEVIHPYNGTHVLHFQKMNADEDSHSDANFEKIITSEQLNAAGDTTEKQYEGDQSRPDWKIYKDGFGNPVVNEDELIRSKANKKLADLFSRRILFEGTYRSGVVIYIEGDLQIRFAHEMYGGEFKFGIEIPSEASWEKETNVPLSRRNEIIEFVASAVQREQAPSWSYVIRENDIAFYS